MLGYDVLRLAAMIWLVIFHSQRGLALLRSSALYAHPDSCLMLLGLIPSCPAYQALQLFRVLCYDVLRLSALIRLIIFQMQRCRVLFHSSASYAHPDSRPYVPHVNTLMPGISSLAAFQSVVL